jgi:hypothetical protein
MPWLLYYQESSVHLIGGWDGPEPVRVFLEEKNILSVPGFEL